MTASRLSPFFAETRWTVSSGKAARMPRTASSSARSLLLASSSRFLPPSRRAISRSLAASGAEASTMNSTASAAAMWSRLRPHALVLDVVAGGGADAGRRR